MGFIAEKKGNNYTPPPVGMHIGRCYRLIDMGTQPKSFQGKQTGEARKISAGFELLGEDRMADGRPFTISKSWFLSMHEKASLRKDLESWRGRAFNADEESAFDVSKLLGAYCTINVIEEQGQDGNTYTRIASISPMMKGLSKPEAVNANIIFDADEPDMEIFETFGEKMKETIKACREWRAKSAGGRSGTVATALVSSTGGLAEMDDDIPF